MNAIAPSALHQQRCGPTSLEIRDRIHRIRQLQQQRQGKINARLNGDELIKINQLAKPQLEFLEQAIARLGLSARAYHRIMRVARTIADLEQSTTVNDDHLKEALGYRQLDRQRE